MLFNSLTFFSFLAVVLAFRFFLPWRYGRWMLVVASYVFYGTANPWYCLLLLSSTLIDFWVARAIYGCPVKRTRKRLLMVSLFMNLGLLGVFKYGGFVVGNTNVLLGWLGLDAFPVPDLILPVGISFYTFQTLSYTIDVYRGTMAPTRDFGAFALYVAYFPQLVAGPIERARNLLPQLIERAPVTRHDLEMGFQRVLWGLVKKVVLADRLGLMVNEVFADPSRCPAPVVVLGIVGFTYQLYLDFSGYTDMAVGIARMMGVQLSENFRWPYLARNPGEFWSRWHMTLTNWFRDYVFRPLGGFQRARPVRSLLNVMIVMSLMGLWHGAAWNFVMFGFLSGLASVVHQGLRIYLPRKRHGPLLGKRWWSRPLGVFLVFLVINAIMVFFRSPTLATAGRVLGGVFANGWGWRPLYNVHLGLVLVLMASHLVRGTRMADRSRSLRVPAVLRGAFWALLILVVIYGAVDTTEKFIYFQF